jgi:hypothetical protein
VLQGISYETLINLIGNDKIISSQYINISNEHAVIPPPLIINIVKQTLNNNLTKETVGTKTEQTPNNQTETTTEQTPNNQTETTTEEIVETEQISNKPIEIVETEQISNKPIEIVETEQISNKPEIKQCVRMKKLNLITPITSYTEFANDKIMARCIQNKVMYKMPNGKVVERFKDAMKLQLHPLILGYFCIYRGVKRITKNNNKYFYNGVKISKNKLTNEMINVTKWILLDYRQKMNSTVYDDIDDLIAKLNNITTNEIKMIYDVIDARV